MDDDFMETLFSYNFKVIDKQKNININVSVKVKNRVLARQYCLSYTYTKGINNALKLPGYEYIPAFGRAKFC